MDSTKVSSKEHKPFFGFNIRNTLYLILFWMLAVLLYKIVRIYGVEAVIEKGMHQGKLSTHILHIFVGSIVVGILFGILDWLLTRSELSKKSYLQILVVKLIAFFGALFIGIICGRLTGECFIGNVNFIDAINDLPEFLISPLVIPLYIYAVVASFAITFIRQVDKKFGSRVLFNLAIGKYFKARETELAEAKEYLEFQVEERTAALKAEIGRRELTEKALRLAKENAESANVAKSQFLANMSHEIRTPLNAIIGFTQILQNQSSKNDLNPNFINYLSNIRISGQHLSELINDILDLSKIEAGKMSLSYEDLNLKQMVQSIYHINKAGAKEKDIILNYDFDPGTPQYIHSDRSKLKQILMNILSNAIKFTPPGKHIYMKTFFNKGHILFEVEDHGIGIEQDKLLAIFDPFVQADTSVTREYGGTGLGLSITKNMVDLLKGKITVKSTPGLGSTFGVSIPYQKAEEIGKYQTQTSMDNISIPGKSRILVVEDNPMNQEMIKAFFNEINHDILVANDGMEGIEMANQYRPDLIFMDIHMPGMDGFEAMQRIKENDPQVPIVALSADAFQEQQNEAIQCGFSDYITKPIELDKLISCLKQFLRVKNEVVINEKKLSQEEISNAFQVLESLSRTPIYETEKLVEWVEVLSGVANKEWTEAILEIIYTGDGKGYENMVEDLKRKILNREMI